MNTDRIDFISAYCDRWCERCAFTQRCSAYACDVATAMCDGDLAAGIELAVGVPQPAGGGREKAVGDRLLEQYEEPSAQEIAAAMEEERARAERVESAEISQVAWTYMMRSHEWLKRRDPPPADADPVVREALDIVAWDSTLVGAKLHRALLARERSAEEAWPDDDPVQNDANGSAKRGATRRRRISRRWRRAFARSSAASFRTRWRSFARGSTNRGADV